MSLEERAAELAHLALTGPESARADNLYDLVKLISSEPKAHRRADCVRSVLDRVFYLMPACETAKQRRA